MTSEDTEKTLRLQIEMLYISLDRLYLENAKLQEKLTMLENADRTLDTTNLVNAKKENPMPESSNEKNANRLFILKCLQTALAVIGAIVALMEGKSFKEDIVTALNDRPRIVSPVAPQRPTSLANPGAPGTGGYTLPPSNRKE